MMIMMMERKQVAECINAIGNRFSIRIAEILDRIF